MDEQGGWKRGSDITPRFVMYRLTWPKVHGLFRSALGDHVVVFGDEYRCLFVEAVPGGMGIDGGLVVGERGVWRMSMST